MELLEDYLRKGSEEAFATVVQRHVNLVYSVALRHVGIPAQAEDITKRICGPFAQSRWRAPEQPMSASMRLIFVDIFKGIFNAGNELL